ncbi:MAG: signal peptidase II [Nitrospirae bacterium]|nr:signal peptidase II [Nitrospirota bacterium]MDA1304293.1 signal peptidase II [Nitrospirota bacterium]
MNDGGRRYLLLVGVSLILVALDQITKMAIMHTMHLHESIPVIKDFFNLTYIRNPGAAFGIFAESNSAFRLIFFVGTSIFALGLLGTIFCRLHPDDLWGQLTVSSIFGGAIGNLIDRLRYGEVVDFLDFHINGYHWPAFNVADSAISVGVVSLLIIFALEKKKEDPPPEPLPQENHP